MNIDDPEKLIGKRIAWNTMSGKTQFGTVRALTMTPDVVIAEFGYGKKTDAAKVSISDIVKVYEKGDK